MEFPLGLSKKEHELLSRLSNPILIQDFLDTLAINYEKVAESCMSPRMVLRERKAHCIEGAMLAASALWISGERPLLLELRAKRGDQDHAVALYKHGEHWGAISKTITPLFAFATLSTPPFTHLYCLIFMNTL